jgi:leucyl-tRNA synthetase
MQERYEPAAVEAEAQQYWDEQRCFEAKEDPAREKYYCLSMFPYPSGRCTWAMCATTPSATCCRASCA